MNLSEALRQYAVESGEISAEEEPIVDDAEDGLADLEDTLEYAIESCCREIHTSLALMGSVNALSDTFLKTPGEVSYESYQQSVHHLLQVAGVDVPVSVFVPSFESAEKEPEGVKDKIRKVGKAVWAAIKRAYERLIEFFKKLVGRRKKAEDAVSAKTSSTEETVDELKKAGITHIANPKPTGADVKTTAYSKTGVPSVFLENGKWSAARIHKLQEDVKTACAKVKTADEAGFKLATKQFESAWDMRQGKDVHEWSGSLTDIDNARTVGTSLMTLIRTSFAEIGSALDAAHAKLKNLDEAKAGPKELDEAREELRKLQTAMRLYDALSTSSTLGWVAISILTNAAIVK